MLSPRLLFGLFPCGPAVKSGRCSLLGPWGSFARILTGMHSTDGEENRMHQNYCPVQGNLIKNIHIRISVGLPINVTLLSLLSNPFLCISVDIQLICSLVRKKIAPEVDAKVSDDNNYKQLFPRSTSGLHGGCCELPVLATAHLIRLDLPSWGFHLCFFNGFVYRKSQHLMKTESL